LFGPVYIPFIELVRFDIGNRACNLFFPLLAVTGNNNFAQKIAKIFAKIPKY